MAQFGLIGETAIEFRTINFKILSGVSIPRQNLPAPHGVHPPTEYAVLCTVQAVATTVPPYPAAHVRPETPKFWRVRSPLWPDKVYPGQGQVWMLGTASCRRTGGRSRCP
jgi:hypothetical protein